jgi:hypothetical protein
MNKRQKLVQQAFLDNEEEVLKRLEKIYGESLSDIEKKAQNLQDDIEELDKLAKLSISDEEKEVLLSRKRSKVYQKQYQEALKKQVNDILDKMHTEEFKTVSEYLDKCYEEGFIGTMYDLQGQGIPLIMPIDQESMVRAVQLDSKISKGLYSRLGEDVSKLKKVIASDVSRGISTGMTFKQIAGQLKAKTNIGYNNAVRIARTEGHRIQCQAGMDACYKAKEKGADVVKQWDATLDSNTRESHVAIDGQIRELDKPFSNGLMFPGDPSGGAAEVINCRCALLQRARKALDDEEFTKMNNFTKQLETFKSPKEYDEFKKAFFSKENKDFMKCVDKMENKYGTKNWNSLLGKMTDKEYDDYSLLTTKNPIFNKKGLEISSKSDIIRLGVVRDAVKSNSVSLKINPQKQNRHIMGSGGFIEGRSRLTIGLDEAQKLVNELRGTGEPIFDRNGEWVRKERVVCSNYVGIHVDLDGKETKTKRLTIHYSATGSHIVPGKDDD